MTVSARPSATRILVAFAILATLAACGESAEPSTTTADTSTTTTSTIVVATTVTAAAQEPDVQAEIDWFVSVLNGEELSEDEYRARFTEEFRQQVPFDEGMQPVLDEFRPAGPYTVVERTGDGIQGEAVVESADGTQARVLAELDDQSRFNGLVIQPANPPTLDDPPDSISEAFGRLTEIGAARALTAEVVDGACVPIEEMSSAEPAPLGSVIKLYVLAAIGEAVQSGEIAWDDEIVIREELKSIPTGVLQDRPAGDVVTVLETAELMISISDNTATDHLIDLIGRENVESVMADYGHTSPELNTPLMNTREFTALKVGPASGLSIQWLEGDEAQRRAILTQISDITPEDLPIQEWIAPIDPDRLEWFASPEDLCNLGVRLSELAGSVPEIGAILEINPGVPAETGTWDSIWFKGGSEPGLLAAWWLTRSGDRTFVTAGSVVDPSAVIDSDEAVLLLAAARDLLAP